MNESTGGIREWIIPAAFLFCTGWVVWQMPAFILDIYPPKEQSLVDVMGQLYEEKDIWPGLPGLFGGHADIVDWLMLVMVPILFIIGCLTVKVAHSEFQKWRRVDRPTLFVGRVTMIIIITMTSVMLYEVFMRYVLESPTLWANELSQWLAGFVFLCSGLYVMQQRGHIRIFLLYDTLPRNLQRAFDTFGVVLICVFAFFFVYGSYQQVFVNKFYKWEMFGTAFDPPIPATVLPAILIVMTLIAVQAVINLINDWNLEKVVHSAADDVDEDEIEALKRNIGVE
ncbi:TRAP transporter small permease subunit [Tropicimonas sp. IMCC6043]|uniref:TRAP transporter small permease subunit n=1 Tax=Tropicimonas sp. IMCC6043 TaxID=2510645 RepID=UPI00101BE7EB|nr:TRAP transporter small permease [Tropicimonas sp. IMCC6043]RYH11583.1 TRAP transporter small permease [Tropicimonas sp. IMCC6043]